MKSWIRKAPVPALLGAVLLFSACEPEPEEIEPPGPGTAVEPLEPPEVQTELEPVGGMRVIETHPFQAAPAAEGPIGGQLQLMIPPTGQPEGLHVRARVEGLSPGPHAWHVHSGPCGEEAPVVVAFTPTAEREGIDQPLVAGPDGVAEETAFIPEEVLARRDIEVAGYSVHVHRAAGVEHGPTVACAPL